jgi:erythromycin esterase
MTHRTALSTILLAGLAACGGSRGPTDSSLPPDTVSSQIIAWLQSAAAPFATAQAGADYDDLMPLKQMIGDARVVALGEATHGTREFFLMKHRVLEFLVKELDFNLFAIEATWPEANRVNDYVHTGKGDPAELLSGLYFWTWNTEAVLDMIRWMRLHNSDPGDAPLVSFFGFDMQYPGMAIHNVQVFLSAADQPMAEFASLAYGCMLPFANGPTGRFPPDASYASQPAAYRDECRDDLADVLDSLAVHRAEYEAASSPEAFAVARQSARVVVQFESMSSQRIPAARDQFMAENARWLLEQAGPEAKIVLWAHNGHVADDPTYGGLGAAMGHHLRATYGNDLVIAGFDFYQGSFRAVTVLPSGTYAGLDEHAVGAPPKSSYEYYFHSAGLERFILDLRGVDLTTPATSWLAGPRKMRTIGAGFMPTSPQRYFYDVSLPARYDLLIYFDDTHASRGLPREPPAEW